MIILDGHDFADTMEIGGVAPRAIGISGFAGTGKTEVANIIERDFGYRRMHIAEPLRRMLRSLLQDFGMPDDEIASYLTGARKAEVIPCLGITSRRAQITLGTEWGREQVSPDLWVNAWDVQSRRFSRVINDSVRFPNEERGIRALGGFTLMIERPGVGPAAFRGPLGKFAYEKLGIWRGVHPSERLDRLDPSYTIVNDGSLADLRRKVTDLMELVL